MTTTLRWPDGRGRFVDQDHDRVAHVIQQSRDGSDAVEVSDVPLDVLPGSTVTVADGDVADHYQDRGFEVVDESDHDHADDADGSQADEDADESADESPDDADADDADGDDGFDAEAFTDRTPVSDVVDDIEAGEADDHLDAVYDADDRVTVQKAVEDRKDEIGGD